MIIKQQLADLPGTVVIVLKVFAIKTCCPFCTKSIIYTM